VGRDISGQEVSGEYVRGGKVQGECPTLTWPIAPDKQSAYLPYCEIVRVLSDHYYCHRASVNVRTPPRGWDTWTSPTRCPWSDSTNGVSFRIFCNVRNAEPEVGIVGDWVLVAWCGVRTENIIQSIRFCRPRRT